MKSVAVDGGRGHRFFSLRTFSAIIRNCRGTTSTVTMNPCQNCGKLNSGETNFCRFCGTRFNVQQPVFEHDPSPPRPYSWKTDEFQTPNEPRTTVPIERGNTQNTQLSNAPRYYEPAPLAHQLGYQMGMPFRCPHCMSQYLPRIERRISTGGWITFAVLLVVFFPLFWIGLLIKEDVRVCQSCNTKLA